MNSFGRFLDELIAPSLHSSGVDTWKQGKKNQWSGGEHILWTAERVWRERRGLAPKRSEMWNIVKIWRHATMDVDRNRNVSCRWILVLIRISDKRAEMGTEWIICSLHLFHYQWSRAREYVRKRINSWIFYINSWKREAVPISRMWKQAMTAISLLFMSSATFNAPTLFSSSSSSSYSLIRTPSKYQE